MKRLVTLLIALSLILPFHTALADQTTAPGQQKKEAGDQSAKDYAPGHADDSDAGEKEREKHQVQATQEEQRQIKAKEKAKAEAGQATPDVGAPKAKGMKGKKK